MGKAQRDKTIAALFVQTGGCYFGIDGVDPWDEKRDAMKYDGPHPVVAHPPCQRWGNIGISAYARWGGEHNRPGNDGGTFAHALDCVRRFGGVLEHPAHTLAWKVYGITKPVFGEWTQSVCGGFVAEVWQSAYGHRARKATWLYVSGAAPTPLDWRRVPGTHMVGGRGGPHKERCKPSLPKKEASATPVAFRDLLIEIARGAHGQA